MPDFLISHTVCSGKLRRVLASVVAAVLIHLIAPVATAQATAYPGVPPLLLGAAWYPEQWPESQWDADLDKMEAAQIHLVRIGEFAWSTMEPEEGKYNFTWLDHAIAEGRRPPHRRRPRNADRRAAGVVDNQISRDPAYR